MHEITLATQTTFAELLQRSLDAEFDDTYRGSYARKLVTARIGRAAYRGVAQRPHFSTEGAICRVER
jgi:hypothetical protein